MGQHIRREVLNPASGATVPEAFSLSSRPEGIGAWVCLAADSWIACGPRVRGRPRVTINSRTADIRGVRDAEGVQNVGKWHEIIHITDHLDTLRAGPSAGLPGFEIPPRIVCYRSGDAKGSPEAAAREFWAEEAGRAAAVSLEALARSEAFQELCRAASTGSGPVAGGFPLLYEVAEDIGVNATALVKQLTLEGWIVVTKESGRNVVYVQPRLNELAGVG